MRPFWTMKNSFWLWLDPNAMFLRNWNKTNGQTETEAARKETRDGVILVHLVHLYALHTSGATYFCVSFRFLCFLSCWPHRSSCFSLFLMFNLFVRNAETRRPFFLSQFARLLHFLVVWMQIYIFGVCRYMLCVRVSCVCACSYAWTVFAWHQCSVAMECALSPV